MCDAPSWVRESGARKLKDRCGVPTGFLMEMVESDPSTADDRRALACLAAEESPDVLALLDPDLTARWVSPSVKAVLGHEPCELAGLGLADLVHFEDLGPIINGIAEAGRIDGRHASVECRLRSVAGAWVPSRITSTTFERDGGTWWVLNVRAVADDDVVLGRRSRLQALAQETALTCSEMRSDERGALAAILENLGVVIGASGIAIWSSGDGDNQLVTSWTRDGRRSVPRPVAPRETLAATGYVVHRYPDDETGVLMVEAVEIELPSSRSKPGVLVAELNQQAGVGAWDDFNVDLAGVIGGLVHAAALRADSEQALLERAETDQLTGLLNSAAVKERIGRLLKESIQGTVAAVFGDLDGFKSLNDRLGHRTGDAVLVAVADGLRKGAGEDAVIGRIGGDEFVAVRIVRDATDAAMLMTRCRLAVQGSLAEFHGVDISLGVALSELGDSSVDLLHRADVDMYTEKRRKARMAADDGVPSWESGRGPEIPR